MQNKDLVRYLATNIATETSYWTGMELSRMLVQQVGSPGSCLQHCGKSVWWDTHTLVEVEAGGSNSRWHNEFETHLWATLYPVSKQKQTGKWWFTLLISSLGRQRQEGL